MSQNRTPGSTTIASRPKGWLLLIVTLSLIASMLIPAAADAQVDGVCTGDVHVDIGDAQNSYTTQCGEEYNGSSGFHFCEWVPGGFQCTGPDSNLAELIDEVSTDNGLCSGDPHSNIDDAKTSYGNLCGEPYSDTSGQHRCDWEDAGWRCTGPDGTDNETPTAPPSPAPTSEPAPTAAPTAAPATGGGPDANGNCSGTVDNNIDNAKTSYSNLCGEPYSDTSGHHRCDWEDAGWRCTGPDSTGGSTPVDPSGNGNSGDDNSGQNADGTCSGAARSAVDDAQTSYAEVCGQAYDPTSGFHSCEWEPEGWRCTGPNGDAGSNDGTGGQTDPTNADPLSGPQADGTCSGLANNDIDLAKASYGEICGEAYDPASGFHSCGWEPEGWRCNGPNSAPVDGGGGPAVDPLFDQPRDTSVKPPTPLAVSVAGGQLQWEMPQGPQYLFQVTRNALTGGTAPNWGQLETTPGDGTLTHADLGTSVQFSLPVGQFAIGDRFTVQAIHPWDITVADGARFSPSSRFAMISNPGDGQTIGSFLTTFGTSAQPEGSWIGSAGDWQATPQWSDDFNGGGLLANRPDPRWYFARSDGNSEVTPAYSRNSSQTDQHAVLNGGRLEMAASRDDGTYSYISTANDNGEGYVVDPTNGVFVEASVRLDRMTPADNAWWAFWLMASGSDRCDANGDSTPNGWNAYDGNARTGTEIDIFEFVPDLGNGFNQAVYRYEYQTNNPTCTNPGQSGLQPFGSGFTYEGHQPLPGINLAKYTDGNYHRLGLYYAQDCLAFYMDDELIWQVTEATNPGWVTPTPRESIRLSWEIQDNDNPWTTRGGKFANTAGDADPTVFIDWVNVWEKRESANGLCSGGADPAQTLDAEPLRAPTALVGTTDGTIVVLDWQPGGEGTPDGYDVTRNGEGYWSVNDGTTFTDEAVVPGETYTYAITPWRDASSGDPLDRTYGPPSETVQITVESPITVVLDPPSNLQAAPSDTAIALSWLPPTSGDTPDGYDINRNGEGYWTVTNPSFIDEQVTTGETYTYFVTPWADDPNGTRHYGDRSAEVTVVADDTDPVDPVDPNLDPLRDVTHPDYNSQLDPDLITPEFTVTTTAHTVTISWAEWAAANPGNYDGVAIIVPNPLGLPTTFRFVDETEFTHAGNTLIGLHPDQTHTYSIGTYKQPASEFALYVHVGPTAPVTFTMQPESTVTAPPVTDFYATRGSDPWTEAVWVNLVWRTPAGLAEPDGVSLNITPRPSYAILPTPGPLTAEQTANPDLDTDLQSWTDGPHQPGTLAHTRIANASVTYELRQAAYFEGRRTISEISPVTEIFIHGMPPFIVDEPEEIHPRVIEIFSELFPNTAPERRDEMVRLYWESYFRVREGIPADSQKLMALRDRMRAEGFDPGVGQAIHLPGGGSIVDQELAALVRNVALAIEPQSLSDIVPGYPPRGGGPVESNRGALRQSFEDTRGWDADERGRRFQNNQTHLETLMAALPERPGRSDADDFEAVEIAAFFQAELILNIDITSRRRDLWEVSWQINNGIHPGRQWRHSDDDDWEWISEPTPFSQLWNAATIDERAAYYGFDPIGWSLADGYLQMSKQMDNIQDDLEDWIRPLMMLVLGAAIAYVTGGLAAGGFAAITGGSATGVAAATFGTVVGSYASTFFLTGGSTSAAEKAAWNSLLTAGIAHYVKIPVGERSWQQHMGIAVMEGGLAVLNDQEFLDGFLESLARNYIPGLSEFIESLDPAGQFLADMASVLVVSYVTNNGNWDEISEDLESYIAGEIGEQLRGFLTTNLPEEWGEFGTALADIAGVAVESEGHIPTILAAIGDHVGALVGSNVGDVFGSDSWQADMAEFLAALAIRAQGEDDPAAYIDEQLTQYLMGIAVDYSLEQLDQILPADWVGTREALANVVAVAEATGDRDKIIEAIAENFGPLIGQSIGRYFGDAQGWEGALATEIANILILSANVPADERLDFISSSLTQLVIGAIVVAGLNQLDELLPQEWTGVRSALAAVTAVAEESGGDRDKILDAIGVHFGGLLADKVGAFFGDAEGEQGWQAALTQKLIALIVESGDKDDPLAFISAELEKFVLEMVADGVSNALEEQLVGLNGGEPSLLIDATVGLVGVVITNLWQDDDALRNIVGDYAQGQLLILLEAAFPECSDGTWIEALALQMADAGLDAIFNGGDASDVGASIGDSLQQTIDQGGIEIDGFGTCNGAPTDPDGPGDGEIPPPAAECGSTAAAQAPTTRSAFATPVLAARVNQQTASSCGFAGGFETWLLGLNSEQVRSDTYETSVLGVGDVVAVSPNFYPDGVDYSALRLRIQSGDITGEVVVYDFAGRFWETTGHVVYIHRDSSGRIDDFRTIDEAVDGLGEDSSLIDLAVSVIRGCISTVTQSWEALRETIIMLWEAEDLGALIVDTWAKFQRIKEAFEHNPRAFFEQFLSDLFSLDLLEEDPAQWAGLIICELGMAMIPGFAARRFQAVFSHFDNDQAVQKFVDSPANACSTNRSTASRCGSTAPPTGVITNTVLFGNNRVEFDQDGQGRTVEARATITEVDPNLERAGDNAEAAAQGRLEGKQTGDQAGHLIAYRFMGGQGDVNLVPQNGNLNQGAYKRLENEVAAFVDAGASVDMRVSLSNLDATGRPGSIQVSFDVFIDVNGTRRPVNTDGPLGDRFSNTGGQTYDRLTADEILDLVDDASR